MDTDSQGLEPGDQERLLLSRYEPGAGAGGLGQLTIVSSQFVTIGAQFVVVNLKQTDCVQTLLGGSTVAVFCTCSSLFSKNAI